MTLGIITKQDIMEHNEQGQRDSAAEDFQKSLDELQHLLEENQTEEQPEKELKIDNTELKQPVEKARMIKDSSL
ncbi:MAG: hypothetical protein AAFX46_18605 [Cyanobacteria bacterium J06636_27]